MHNLKLLVLLTITILLAGIITISQFAAADDIKNNGNHKDASHFKEHTVLVGDGPPPNELGKVGDLYIDDTTSTLTLYNKTTVDTWKNIGNFSGPPGPAGPPGKNGLNG